MLISSYLKMFQLVVLCSLQTIQVESSTAHSSSPETMETPHGEAELFEGGDIDELSKQMERER